MYKVRLTFNNLVKVAAAGVFCLLVTSCGKDGGDPKDKNSAFGKLKSEHEELKDKYKKLEDLAKGQAEASDAAADMTLEDQLNGILDKAAEGKSSKLKFGITTFKGILACAKDDYPGVKKTMESTMGETFDNVQQGAKEKLKKMVSGSGDKKDKSKEDKSKEKGKK